MDAQTLFFIGVILGFLAGVLVTIIGVKTKSLFSSSEARKLRQEKEVLKKRLREKDKYIGEMMGHAEKLAQDFNAHKSSQGNKP